MNIFWFRRDLRIQDNRGFFEALNAEQEVLPVFIFDTYILDQLSKDDARVSFIHDLLFKINTELQKAGKSLAVFYGEPLAVFEKLASEHDIQAVYANDDYEPYARKRDLAVADAFKWHGIDLKIFKDHVIFEKDEVCKDDGKPYVVFTPYSKKWKENIKKIELKHYRSEEQLNNIALHSYPFLSLDEIGFQRSKIEPAAYDISDALIEHYEETRNFPALKGTSMLGPYLRFGAISIRYAVGRAAGARNETFLNELIWREFFAQVLWHFPETVNRSFRVKYDGIRWRYDEADFEKWCAGQTGYPIVDAGMRELNATGHMHNRVRMVVASFLCKHLLIDWRWGEAYFATKLLDYEQASNVGNWQWAAGSGVDAAPYFRIFNPAEQVKKFDKGLEYVRKWVPEMEEFSYVEPIVEHRFARERCLRVYKEAVA